MEVQSDSGLAKPQMLVFCVNINATGGGLLGFPLHLRYPPPTSESSSTVSFYSALCALCVDAQWTRNPCGRTAQVRVDRSKRPRWAMLRGFGGTSTVALSF